MAEIALGRKPVDAMDDWPVQYGWWLKHREWAIERIRADGAANQAKSEGEAAMKLMMFEKGNGAALGLVENNAVVDLGAADASLPKDLQGLMLAEHGPLTAAKAAAAKVPASARLPLDAVKPALPISPCGKNHLRRAQLRAARQGGWARHPHLPFLLPARA